ncbi:MAG: Gfo/Idh/MocA family oxidoreductase [Opitutales bacterium]|nr:Gfo/Idh/MocA family oxidoreductase [Opitutales bacterium]
MKNQSIPSPLNMNRRSFVKKSALGAGVMVLPSVVAGQSTTETSPNSKLNIAIIGVAGKGMGPTIESVAENVIALCDVDKGKVAESRTPKLKWGNPERFDQALKTYESRGAKWYQDYRIMFEELSDKLDAVIISTPDHMHFPIAMSAINLGIHVYCEKPLTHTVSEARLLATAAKKKGLVTQMGNQGHSNSGTRLVKEWIEAGVIGPVREVHSWTDRPARFWQQGLAQPDHSKFIPVVPEGLDWELWQGVAPRRPYDPAYAPFRWRAYVDYGCGSLGDMACHIMDSAYWGLNLTSPTSIEAVTTSMNGFTFPVSSMVTYQFPKRPNMPAVTYKWYDGDLRPTIPHLLKGTNPFTGEYHKNGSLIIGEEAIILTDTYSKVVKILPQSKFMELRRSLPPKTLRRVKGSHLNEFYSAIRENRKASSDFSYAAPFTETVLLGTIAQRTGRKLDFDGAAGKFIDDEEANNLLKKDYPNGWILG